MTKQVFMILGCTALLVLVLAGCRTANPVDLRCECEELAIAYVVEGSYETREQCEAEADREALYKRVRARSQDYCDRWYRCVHPDCPERVLRAPGAAEACRCIQITGGFHDGRWTLECDLTRGDTECCCVPST